MQIRLYKTADNPRKLVKSYTPDQTIARTFENVDAAVFENGSEYNIAALKLDFEAQQAGEGDPSPDNVRPITGHTQATVNLRSGNEFRSVFKPFGDTYYSGIFDAVNGKLYNTGYYKVFNGTESWSQAGTGEKRFYYTNLKPDSVNDYTVGSSLCSIFKLGNITAQTTEMNVYTLAYYSSYRRVQLRLRPSGVTSIDELKAFLQDNNCVCYYKLNTATSVSIGPLIGLNLFPGVNRLWATNMLINELSLSVKSGSALITTDNGTEYSNVQFISENDRKNPVLRVVTDTDLTAYNYAYISYYDRFYFVKVRNIAQGVYALECSVDLLMTCKSDLLNLNCTIKRNAASGSPYLYDELYHTQMYKLWAAKEFPQGLTNESFVLMTVGTNTTP